MKKMTILLTIGGLLLANQLWADSIETVSVSAAEPVTVEMTGNYSDGCPRNPIILLTELDDEVIFQVFTETPAEGDPCIEEPGVPFTLSHEFTTSVEEYRLTTLLYEGMLNQENSPILIDSEILLIGSEGDQEPFPSEDLAVDVVPQTINMKRNGQTIGVKLELEGNYVVEDIDTENLVIIVVYNDMESSPINVENIFIDEETMMVKLNNFEVLTEIENMVDTYPTEIIFEVSCQLNDGSIFVSSNTARVINPGKNY